MGLPVLEMVSSPQDKKYSKPLSQFGLYRFLDIHFFTLYRTEFLKSSFVEGKGVPCVQSLDLRLRNKVSFQSSPSESFDHWSVEDLPSCNQTFLARFFSFLGLQARNSVAL